MADTKPIKTAPVSPSVSDQQLLQPSSSPPPPPPETVSSAKLADAISSRGVTMSLQFRAVITEEALGAELYRQMVSFYTRFEGCYTQEASKVLMRKKAIFLMDTASAYMEKVLRDCYHSSCIDTYGKAKKSECEAVAYSRDEAGGVVE